MPKDDLMPDLLTAEELRELDDLEAHIHRIFKWAGGNPTDEDLEELAVAIRSLRKPG